MYIERLRASYEANPRGTILNLIGIGLGIVLAITGFVFAFKEARSQPTPAAAKVFPIPPQEPFVSAINSVIPPADTNSQLQELQIDQPADQPQVKCTLDPTTEPKTIDCTVEVPDEQTNVQSNDGVAPGVAVVPVVTEPTPVVTPEPTVTTVVTKLAVKPVAKPKQIGIAATLNNYRKVNGKKVATQEPKDEHPSVSSKDKGIHVDEDCSIDPDEIPNLNCYYPPTDNKSMVKAMAQAQANIDKKLGSKYKK